MENYNKILDECIDLILNQNYSLEDCLAKYPEFQNELSQDLKLAKSINNKLQNTINEEAKIKAKSLLLKKFNSNEKHQPKTPKKFSGKVFKGVPLLISRWSSIAAAILIFSTVGTTSLVSASSDSNPDENLYPVKRAVENMRLRFTFNSEKKNELRLGYSNKRIQEMTSMADKGIFEQMEILQEDLEKNIEIISNNDSETVKEKIFKELKEGYITKEEAENFFKQEKINYEDTNKTHTGTDITYPRKERIMKLKHYIENKELKIKELCRKIEKFDSPEHKQKMAIIENNNPQKWERMKTRQDNLLKNCEKHMEKHALYKEKLTNLMSEKITAKYMVP